ncbi:DnaJ domain-containing protein [Roseofilum sp. BLCC_M154]|uniref:DnaJ domain-containing protein n=1 Tax=Roseofilum acuticapitatum BLCC-M154 TaxID=3022444 RepID=A0ABT7AUB9_9CYAN|nr:DnaJ domain-containing protein [Roseofilum acuticapitatum]MDJ1170507.1 DnaJ domain-containing protein [Roseofilum acuticapitatum BLCC-M154]
MNYYQTLEIEPRATAEEIRQAYRRLVKLHHPDLNPEVGSADRMVAINLAYETLSDVHRRRVYDREKFPYAQRSDRPKSTKSPTRSPQKPLDPDRHWQQWLSRVYHPVNASLIEILDSIETEIDDLSADPFDDQLLENFQIYLDNCRSLLDEAQVRFRSLPNPGPVASIAAHLYYCLNQVSDGLDEFSWFPQNYDEHYLHTGLELFRIARGLRQEAQEALQEVYADA